MVSTAGRHNKRPAIRSVEPFTTTPVGAASRLLKDRVMRTESGNVGDRVISEARGIWSHLLLLGLQERLPI
jgi:hypothetical protein